MIINAWYVSVWDGGVTLKSPCLYDEEKKRCFSILPVDVDGVGNLDFEAVELPPDGRWEGKCDGVTFEY